MATRLGLKKPKARNYTTGAIAHICGVSMRSVTKWFDSGHIAGFRLPGGQDRRVTRESLVSFLREHGMSDALERLEAETREVVLLVGVPATGDLATWLGAELPERPIATAADAFHAGLVYRDRSPGVVVIDLAGVGRGEGMAAAKRLMQLEAPPVLVALVPEDCGREQWLPLMECGFRDCLQHPVDPATLAGLIAGEVAR